MQCKIPIILGILLSSSNAFNPNEKVVLFLNAYLNSINHGERQQCIEDLKVLMEDALNMKMWALQMLDATAKPQTGILVGNIRNTGSYDECLGIKHDWISGKYCTATLKPRDQYKSKLKLIDGVENYGKIMLPDFKREKFPDTFYRFNISWGFCVPASCRQEELQKVSNYTVEKLKSWIYFEFNDEACSTAEGQPIDGKTIFALLFFSCIALIMIGATFYEIYFEGALKGKPDALLMAFSIRNNTKKLFSTKISPDSLPSINGIRVISLSWVIIGHNFVLNARGAMNSISIYNWQTYYESTYIISSYYAVDTFFALGGMLVIYVTLSKGTKMSITTFYVHRLIRLTPALFALIVFYLGIMNHLGSGPHWHEVRREYGEPCDKYWWSVLLFIQNYMNPLEGCAGHTWYLNAETHMQFMAPLIFIPLRKYPKRTFLFILLIFVSSSLAIAATTVAKRLGSVMVEYNNEYSAYLYYPTHMRVNAWLVGAVWGYILHKKKNTKPKLNKIVQFLFWFVALYTMLTIMFLQVLVPKYDYNLYLSVVLNVSQRPLWAACVGWVVFACSRGYGGLINSFLSMKMFVVISKLSYSMYLVHIPLMIVVMSQNKNPTYFSNFMNFWGYFTVTFFISIVWTLAFESPVVAIEKLLFQRDPEGPNERTRRDIIKTI